ncbi:MAG: hypothetical protein HZA50_11675 [Planctomycetes bacterium]|nr:hypothetical protein [Planctomycetota bacterium]
MAQFKKNHDLSGLIESAWRFTPHTFAAKASAGRWKCWPYLRYIGDAVAECIQTGGRLIINAPPRHGKSEFISFWTPLWFLSLYPDKYILLGSYGETLAADWGRKCRNEIERNPDIGIRLRSDSTSAERWHTVQGGGMACAGVGGPITGRGGNLLLADDLCKDWRDAWSPLIRSRTQEWYSSTFRTRAEPGAAIIIITTRWHADDLVGWLTEQHAEPWKIINLAALAEPGDILGRRPGEALCPQRFDEKALAATRLSIGPAAWSALYQGRPIQVGAGLAYEN